MEILNVQNLTVKRGALLSAVVTLECENAQTGNVKDVELFLDYEFLHKLLNLEECIQFNFDDQTIEFDQLMSDELKLQIRENTPFMYDRIECIQGNGVFSDCIMYYERSTDILRIDYLIKDTMYETKFEQGFSWIMYFGVICQGVTNEELNNKFHSDTMKFIKGEEETVRVYDGDTPLFEIPISNLINITQEDLEDDENEDEN